MYWFPLDHLQKLVIFLYYHMSAIYVCMKFSRPKQTERHTLSMFMYLVSTSVSVLLVKAIGLLF